MDKKAKKLILVDKITVCRDVVFNEDEEKNWIDKTETTKLQAWPQQSNDDKGDVIHEKCEKFLYQAIEVMVNQMSQQLPKQRQGPWSSEMELKLNPQKDKKLWTKAIEEERASHEKNKTWAIDSKWVFKVIKDTDVTQRNLELIQFDVRTALLYSELDKTVLMEVPEGLKTSRNRETTVCKLKKSLYGLKQSPRC
ncbi:hypothetical protein KM043_000129 [Ampulex compressa]|nr:hypothetical protein KM043_000129 [Ampulex compressa]